MLLYLLIHIKRFFHTPPLLQLAGKIIRSHSSHRRLQQRKIIQKNSELFRFRLSPMPILN